MKVKDTLQFSIRALSGFGGRTWLMLLAMAIGVGSVVVLTALGDGARRYVINEFAQLGTHLLVVLPGRSETTGGHPPIMGETPRDLTLDDALALRRSPFIKQVAPIIVGSAPVSSRQREREVNILGTTAELYGIRHLEMSQGKFLPPGDPQRGSAVTVLGAKLKSELFGNRRALGRWVRIGERRFRVIGVLTAKGQSLGTDISDLAIIPVATAQSLFNRASLFRILVQARSRESIPRAKQAVLDIIRERHDGEDDITVITQDAVLATFDGIFRALTMAATGIATISLVVAGILIMNVMLVAVSQRTTEIGLLKALGAPQKQILRLFLLESALLSVAGAACGIAIAFAGVWALDRAFPDFPLQIPPWSLGAAVAVALATGLLFGVLPARRAARMDPVQALNSVGG
ncbi:MAG TPA: FtsX-like permease family protein [Sedimenticola sp.]|nr:FtsX-like permease family protein [Sedimenticola sp.]